jgi:hypothetical protein
MMDGLIIYKPHFSGVTEPTSAAMCLSSRDERGPLLRSRVVRVTQHTSSKLRKQRCPMEHGAVACRRLNQVPLRGWTLEAFFLVTTFPYTTAQNQWHTSTTGNAVLRPPGSEDLPGVGSPTAISISEYTLLPYCSRCDAWIEMG